MATEFKLPPLDEAVRRLDALFHAVGSDAPMIEDWVAVRFALQRLEKLEELPDNGVILTSTSHPQVWDRKWWPGFYRDERWAHPENRQLYRWAGAGPRAR